MVGRLTSILIGEILLEDALFSKSRQLACLKPKTGTPVTPTYLARSMPVTAPSLPWLSEVSAAVIAVEVSATTLQASPPRPPVAFCLPCIPLSLMKSLILDGVARKEGFGPVSVAQAWKSKFDTKVQRWHGAFRWGTCQDDMCS